MRNLISKLIRARIEEDDKQYEGIFPLFELNRPLNQSDTCNQFEQGKTSNLDIKDFTDAGIISFNSTYLELFDSLYFIKSATTFMILVFAVLLFLVGVAGICFGVKDRDLFTLCSFAIMIKTSFVISYLYLFPCIFKYKYYPIRFNRKNKKVYFFKNNTPKGVICIDWKNIYFTKGVRRIYYKRDYTGQTNYDLRAHILDNKKNVIETFVIGRVSEKNVIETFVVNKLSKSIYSMNIKSLVNKPKNSMNIESLWRFIQHYMQDDSNFFELNTIKELTYSKKNTLRNAILTCYYDKEIKPLYIYTSILPGLCHYFILGLNRYPKWPDYVEKECQIETNDPYQLDEPVKMKLNNIK